MSGLVVHVVRHGETEWSAAGKHTGRTDIPLTREGEEQAKRLEPILHRTPYARVLSSPLGRTTRTAELAGFPNVETTPLLLEADYGEDEGRTRAEIRKERPDWDYFLNGPKGGESLDDVAKRATELLAQLSGTVLLFSHGHFTRILTTTWLGKAPREGRHFRISPASLAILSDEHGTPAIELWNFTPR